MLKTMLLILVAALTFSCTRHAGKVTQMPPMEAMGMLRNDFAVLVDVRTPDQQKDGMAQGAISMPATSLDTSKLSKEKRVIVYGSNAADSAKTAEQLAAEGYDVGNIGTYDDWVKAGLPTQKR